MPAIEKEKTCQVSGAAKRKVGGILRLHVERNKMQGRTMSLYYVTPISMEYSGGYWITPVSPTKSIVVEPVCGLRRNPNV